VLSECPDNLQTIAQSTQYADIISVDLCGKANCQGPSGEEFLCSRALNPEEVMLLQHSNVRRYNIQFCFRGQNYM
jgi:hypothetical protein